METEAMLMPRESRMEAALRPLPGNPAVVAYNAWLRYNTSCRTDFDVDGKSRLNIRPWEPRFPQQQAACWCRVARAAREIGLDPDLYVWRLTRESHLLRRPNDLPDLAQEAKQSTVNLTTILPQGILSVTYNLKRLNSLRLEIHYGCHHRARYSKDQVASLLPPSSRNPVNIEYALAVLDGEDDYDENGELNHIGLDLVFRWGAARDVGYEKIARLLQPAACMELWMQRDIYARCVWGQVDIPGMIAMARAAYAATMTPDKRDA